MRTGILIGLILVIPALSCSRNGPPSLPAVEPARGSDSHLVWGVWRMDFDEESMGISAVPLRSAMLHANVTPFIMPPACSNCLTLVVKQFSKPLGILNMEATLKNPTSFTGYDVRAILRWQTAYIWLANPDDYTTLFDDGGTKTLNPFIAYATEKADRAFKAGASHTRPIQLRFSQAGHFSEITFVVDASWPTHCTEPYQISDQQVSGSLVGGLPVEVQCNVLDWQNDVTSVAVQPGDLSDVSMVLTHQTGTSWKGLITNKKGAAPGVYSLLLRAVSPGGSTDSLYDYLGVTVATTPVKGLDPGPWPMLGFDTRHTAQSPFYGPTASPALAWDSATQGTTWTAAYSGACLSASGRLYVAAGSGIYCLDLNGNYVWSKPPPFDSAYPPPQPLLTAGGAVVVCWSSLMSNSDPQGIYAYKQTNGDLLWSTKTIEFYPYGETKGFSVYDSPVVSSDDMLVAVAREHIVVALDASDGSQQWIWPNDTSKYQSILPGSYLDAWRCSPPMTSDGSFVVVADWFDTPRLVVLSDMGWQMLDWPLSTLTTVNCHPMVTSDDKVILGGFKFDGIQAKAAVEARNLSGTFLWDYVDDTIQLFQGVAAQGPDGTFYFLDGTGGDVSTYPNDYKTYLVALKSNGDFKWRKEVFSRPTAADTSVIHLRNGVSVGHDGTIYVSASWRHQVLSINYITGIAAMNTDGDVLWSYGVEQNAATTQGYYGTPTIGPDGIVYVTKYDRLQALK